MTEPTKGSKAWGNQIKKKAIELSHSMTTNYVELAKVLYTIDDTPVDGDPNNPAIYTSWKYETLAKFAAQELGLEPRKANYLHSIGFTLLVELANSDPEWLERYYMLGWCKVREISRVIKAHQLQDWVLKAEQATYKEVQDMVIRYKTNENKATLARLASAGPATLAKDPFGPPKVDVLDGVEVNSVTQGASFDETQEVPVTVPVIPPIMVPVPEPEKITTETFAFYEGQLKNVQDALKMCSKISGSDKKSNNLALICMDFLATNSFTNADEEQRLKFLAKLETHLGYKLIAADPYTFEPAYGLETLKRVAEVMVSEPVAVHR